VIPIPHGKGNNNENDDNGHNTDNADNTNDDPITFDTHSEYTFLLLE